MTEVFITKARVAPQRSVFSALVVIGVWLSCVVALGQAGNFHAAPDQPPVTTLLAMLVPPTIFWLGMQNRTFRTQVLMVDPIWLNGMQGLRNWNRQKLWGASLFF